MTINSRRGAWLGGVAALAAVALTGCGTSAHHGTAVAVQPPAIPARPAAPAPGSTPPMPLDPYNAVPDASAITQAENLLTERCMQQKGFTWTPGPPGGPLAALLGTTPSGASSESAPLAEPYGIDSAAQAAQFGYHSPTRLQLRNYEQSHPGAQSQLQPLAQHPAAYWIALDGEVPGSRNSNVGPYGGGCSGQAAERVGQYARNQADLQLPGQLEAQAASDTGRDSRVIRVEQAWSSCMARKGFSYATPMAPAQADWPLVPGAGGALEPSPREIATAEADVACKGTTDLPGIWLAVQAGYERQLIAANQAALTASLRDSQAAGRRAEQIVAGGT
jgi:hypothetical protein